MKHFHSHCDIFLPYIIYSDYSCFSCFFVLLCVLIWLCMYGGTWRPPKPLTFHWMLVSSLLVNHFPTHMLVTIKHCLIIYGSFYLVFRLACVCASPYTHPKNASSPTWVPSCSFMSVHTHMSILGNFPGHKGTEIIPCWTVFLVNGVSFCPVFLCFSVIAPHRAHSHPFTPVHTLTYTRLHWKYVYFMCFMLLI